MAATAWQTATVVSITPQTPAITAFRLRTGEPFSFSTGQHIVVRLRAPDGYVASRSYSIASAPDDTAEFEIAVERLPDGEVSGYLHDGVLVGDELEIRGPIGGWFTWTGETPALLVGGGSGLVPLLSMLRLSRAVGGAPARLVVSVRDPASLPFADELTGPDVGVVFTRQTRADDAQGVGRLDAADLAWSHNPAATAYVCGSSGFADAAAHLLQGMGFSADRLRLERFGPTGT